MPRKSKKGGAVQKAHIAVAKERIWSCAVYARLSLEDSGRKGADTIETQIELVASYVKQRPDLFIADTYIDNGVSGKDFDRPAWNRLMDDIRAGRIDCVCVKDLSRFSRNYIESCEFLEKIFPFMGVRFVSVNDGYDSNTAGSKNDGLIVALKSLVHDQYLKDISRKTSSAVMARRARGEYTGAFAPMGYNKSKSIKGKLEPDEITAPIVRNIFKWRAEGMSQQEICKKLETDGVPCPSERLKKTTNVKGEGFYKSGIWQPKSVRQIIRSPIYLGHLVYGKTRQSLAEHKPLTTMPQSEWQVKENMHEPLVSRELWDAANVVEMERHNKYYANLEFAPLPENIFRSYLVCGLCGSKLVRAHNVRVNPSGKRYEYYYYGCTIQRIHADEPDYKRIRLDAIQDLALAAISEKLKSASNLGTVIEKRAKRQVNPRAVLDMEITRVSRELETINQRLSGLYESYVDKKLTEMDYVSLRATYEGRAETLRRSIDNLSRRAAVVEDVSVSDNRWLKAARDFQNPVALTREMLEAIVDYVEVIGTKEVRIAWKFNDEYALLIACAEEKENQSGVEVVAGRKEGA